ncbi:MAG TPA: RICIN domain-containing protein [Actinoplanes sp.]|nr:RICIN domain-containing protein [Actinoplanes sp.]
MCFPELRRTLLAALLGLVTAVGLLGVTGTAAHAATGLAGKCIGAAGGNTADGTAIDLYSCAGDATQQWTKAGRRHGPDRG